MISIRYTFNFDNREKKEFEVRLDPETLNIDRPSGSAPEWTRLTFEQCENCPLDPSRNPQCPVAVNLAPLVSEFDDVLSHEEAEVTVTTEDRMITKRTPVQTGLFPLMGVIMAASGCPVMDKLKPMVRFHLPFASIEETTYRMAAMYLVAQYFRKKRGMDTDWDLAGLPSLYAEVSKINLGMSKRLQAAAERDSSRNALAHLDVFAVMLNQPPEWIFDALEPIFASYLGPPEKGPSS